MDLRILKEVNDLWSKIYPYLAAQVMEYYGKSYGDVLELGPFAGGISVELGRLHPGLNMTLAAQNCIGWQSKSMIKGGEICQNFFKDHTQASEFLVLRVIVLSAKEVEDIRTPGVGRTLNRSLAQYAMAKEE